MIYEFKNVYVNIILVNTNKNDEMSCYYIPIIIIIVTLVDYKNKQNKMLNKYKTCASFLPIYAAVVLVNHNFSSLMLSIL